MVDELGIGAIVDLRSTGEVGADGRGPLRDRPPVYHHLPLFDGPLTVDPELVGRLTLADRYFLMAERAQAPVARVVGVLAECSTPAVCHCAAGKDRTGLISAIVLGLLGVPDEFIVADYAATQENLDAIIDRLKQSEAIAKRSIIFRPTHCTPSPKRCSRYSIGCAIATAHSAVTRTTSG
jgi:hypothetical protein